MKFTELSDKAKQRAVEEYVEHVGDYDWWRSTVEFAKEDGAKLGFNIDEVFFSGFSSQGDGASWIGTVDPAKYLQVKLEASQSTDTMEQVLLCLAEHGAVDGARISHSGSYYHEYSMHTDGFVLFDAGRITEGLLAGAVSGDLVDTFSAEWMEEFNKELLEAARDYAREIYKRLESEYDCLCSEEHCAEMSEANGWDYDEDGRLL